MSLQLSIMAEALSLLPTPLFHPLPTESRIWHLRCPGRSTAEHWITSWRDPTIWGANHQDRSKAGSVARGRDRR